MDSPSKRISTILKHESKRNTYKIALVRALNDVALEYPHLGRNSLDVAVPLSLLAEFWFAYYWAFVDPKLPIRQGHDATDFSFREDLTAFRTLWQSGFGADSPAEGYYIKNVMGLVRKRATYSTQIQQAYETCIAKAAKALQQPIRYAGTGEYTLFHKPQRLRDLVNVVPIPSADDNDLCLVVPRALWAVFEEHSLWIEALCIHEWCLFTETVKQPEQKLLRGEVYTLLTARPDNRRPLTWERNQIDLLLMEGYQFACPWTQKLIRGGSQYDLDHIIPISIRPMNELWNLVPADPHFNSHTKRDRLPSPESLSRAQSIVLQTYEHYLHSKELRVVLEADTKNRFGVLSTGAFSVQLVNKMREFVLTLAELRHVSQF